MMIGPKWLNKLFRLLIEVIRLLPQMVLLYVLFFSNVINLSAIEVSTIIFSLWVMAEVSDLIEKGLKTIDSHQTLSAQSLGLTRFMTYRYVLLPQLINLLIPNLLNLTTRVIKTTSITLLIGVVEALKATNQVIEANRYLSPNGAFSLYLFLAIGYFVICFPLSQLSKFLERKPH